MSTTSSSAKQDEFTCPTHDDCECGPLYATTEPKITVSKTARARVPPSRNVVNADVYAYKAPPPCPGSIIRSVDVDPEGNARVVFYNGESETVQVDNLKRSDISAKVSLQKFQREMGFLVDGFILFLETTKARQQIQSPVLSEVTMLSNVIAFFDLCRCMVSKVPQLTPQQQKGISEGLTMIVTPLHRVLAARGMMTTLPTYVPPPTVSGPSSSNSSSTSTSSSSSLI